eukprot:2165765-Rhodomonas_salina.1
MLLAVPSAHADLAREAQSPSQRAKRGRVLVRLAAVGALFRRVDRLEDAFVLIQRHLVPRLRSEHVALRC